VKVDLGGQVDEVELFVAVHGGVRTIFVSHRPYFDREFLYGMADRDYPDNPERFAFLSRAALTWAAQADPAYDVIHAHDWQTGLVPVMAAQRSWGEQSRPATVFTIHNLAYQGLFDASWLSRLGLGWDLFDVGALEYWGRISFLKGGILFSNLVTTVSPRYASEIQTPEMGCGFDGILRERAADLVGILNGIDYDEWDPAADPNLPAPFGASKLTGKAASKRKVLEAFGLPTSASVRRRPLVAMISRMVDQKGFDLLAEIAEALPALAATFVLLGRGEPRYEAAWRGLADRCPSKIGVKIDFDVELAHLIEGGADLFLMPSRFEPCGLNQMYSLRYGTVPIVHATGGLFDTVTDVDSDAGSGTGFTFSDYSPAGLLGALGRAIHAFEDRPRWRRIQRAGMRHDFSWEGSAKRYLDVYKRSVGQRRALIGLPVGIGETGDGGPGDHSGGRRETQRQWHRTS
jgi:starch synthase